MASITNLIFIHSQDTPKLIAVTLKGEISFSPAICTGKTPYICIYYTDIFSHSSSKAVRVRYIHGFLWN